jgi:hypothetical protein
MDGVLEIEMGSQRRQVVGVVVQVVSRRWPEHDSALLHAVGASGRTAGKYRNVSGFRWTAGYLQGR